MAPKVLIIGSGATGAVIAHAIRRSVPHSDVSIWDKGRRPGGRFATTRLTQGVAVDTGAQYINVAKPYSSVITSLLDAEVLKPAAGIRIDALHYPEFARSSQWMAPDGASSIPTTLLSIASISPTQSRRVEQIVRLADGRLKVLGKQDRPSTGGVASTGGTGRGTNTAQELEDVEDTFDAVVCTVPAPQAHRLLSTLPVPTTADHITVMALSNQPSEAGTPTFHAGTSAFDTMSLEQALQKVRYSVRHAVALAYTQPTHAMQVHAVIGGSEGTTARHLNSAAHGVQYVNYVGLDSLKRHSAMIADHPGTPATVILHSLPYMEGAMAEWEDPNMGDRMIREFRQLYPGLPEPDLVKKHRWRYSQVVRGFRLKGRHGDDIPVDALAFPSAAEDQASASRGAGRPMAPLILAGDYMTESNLVGCIKSGTAAAELLVRRLNLQMA